jgi:hypothetical protein
LYAIASREALPAEAGPKGPALRLIREQPRLIREQPPC